MMTMMRGGPGFGDPAQFTATNISVKQLITRAYNLKPFQVSGPGWLDGDRYDLTAKIPPGATQDEFRQMLQRLLAERFGMKVHHETKEVPVMVLVVAKGGPKFAAAKPLAPIDPNNPPPPPQRSSNGVPGKMRGPGARMMMENGEMKLDVVSQEMDALCDVLANQLGVQVEDRTGLTGVYDFSLEFAPDFSHMGGIGPPPPPPRDGGVAAAAETAGPTLETAIRQQLGLKLERSKGNADLLEIDKINRTPAKD